MKKVNQMSESLWVASLLTISGGLMDAYSYLMRGHVFANAQTGNILLFGVYAANKQFQQSIHYLFPILAFGFGIALCQSIRMMKPKNVHWRQITVMIEIILLVVVGLLPTSYDLLANCLTSLACGLQVQAFRKLHGMGFATTMCIGNLRTGTQELVTYLYTKNKQLLHSGLTYFYIILCFVLGAILGSKCLDGLQTHTIWICALFLLCAVLIMCIDKDTSDN